MNVEHLKHNSDILYNLTNYPVFLLDSDFRILCSPASFYKFHNDAFCEYKDQIDKMIQKDQSFYMVYKHGYFYSCILLDEENARCIWIGPILLNTEKAVAGLSEDALLDKLVKHYELADVLQVLPILHEKFSFLVQLIYQNFLHITISLDQLSTTFRQELLAFTQDRLQQLVSKKRELDNRHYNHHEELKLLYHIRQGDAVSARVIAANLAKGRFGQLSTSNKKIPFYAFISLTSSICKTVIESGVDIETAYGLNDLYIQAAEEIDTCNLQQLGVKMIIDFCLLVKQKNKHNYPAWILQCMNFITLNLHQSITLDMIADEVHMLSTYVSVEFKKNTGTALMNYIQRKKIEEAAFLLRSSTIPILEISTLLAFSSQAYFSTIFKQQMGVSPKSYRNMPFDPFLEK